ncbi:hypothetical protein Cni_G21414 [Canna indica]|uniref:Alpha/beta hydrolase fold-3 domain-containing protein n=1 Tax=Canna indica TaxID=4628 RepID=A0AAQ3KVR9_9LILI|nr:hypothetical protein Cni_G21414 [Canna indica]
MGAFSQLNDDDDDDDHGPVVEEIEKLIKVYKDGHVERLPAVADVPCTWTSQPDVVCRDAVVAAGLRARLYLPKLQGQKQLLLPLLVYFHGGGFCVGSANCAVLSASYRLAPEHRLPAAFDDGLAVLRWVRQQQAESHRAPDELSWWRSRCDFARVFIAGDSAGATIAYHVAAMKPAAGVKGMILIQPFFGGAARTWSEKNLPQSSRSALSLATSDCYWRLALPVGADRDHPWCNPLAKKLEEESRLPAALVCVSELDILSDRNMEFCDAMRRAGKRVEQVTFAGVGHAFQVLHNYQMSQARTIEMLSHIRAFINR